MSFSAIAWALEQGRSQNLPTAERMLLVALGNHLNEKTGRCDPGQATLHADTGLTERHIRDLAMSLVHRGLVQIRKIGRALHYRLLRDAAPQQPAETPEASSSVEEIIPEYAAAVVDTTREPSSGNGRDDTGTERTRHRNSVPKHRNSVPTKLEETGKRETSAPRSPPPSGGQRAPAAHSHGFEAKQRARPRSWGNAFADMLAAQRHKPLTIDGNAEDVVDFQPFLDRLRGTAYG